MESCLDYRGLVTYKQSTSSGVIKKEANVDNFHTLCKGAAESLYKESNHRRQLYGKELDCGPVTLGDGLGTRTLSEKGVKHCRDDSFPMDISQSTGESPKRRRYSEVNENGKSTIGNCVEFSERSKPLDGRNNSAIVDVAREVKMAREGRESDTEAGENYIDLRYNKADEKALTDSQRSGRHVEGINVFY